MQLDIYAKSKRLFTQEEHYVYSPRELTRWVQHLASVQGMEYDALVQYWYYEGLCLFQNRLITQSQIADSTALFQSVCMKYGLVCCHDPTAFFSDWTSKEYKLCTYAELSSFLTRRLETYAVECNQ